MLVLTRRPGESVLIGDDVKVVFFGLHNKQMKIGIDAPIETKIVRTELTERGNGNAKGKNN